MTYRKRQAAKRHAKLNATFTKLTLCLYIFVAGWACGSVTYGSADGFGFVTNWGGYHVSLLGD